MNGTYDQENRQTKEEAERVAAEARQVQEELERQLRQFGGAVNDAFAHGFEGRGQELGDRAWDVGRAVVNMANFGLSEAGRILDLNLDQEGMRRRGRRGRVNLNLGAEGTGAGDASAYFDDARQEQNLAGAIRASARKRFGAGLAMVIVGGIFAFSFAVAAIACLAAAGSMTVGAITVEEALITAEGVAMAGTAAVRATQITGWVFVGVTAPFLWMICAGAERIKASKRLKLYASAAEGVDTTPGIPLELLAGLTHQKKKKTLKELRELIRKGWLTAWLDERRERLFLRAEDFRAAQKGAAATAPKAQEKDKKKEKSRGQAPAQPETQAPAQPQPAAGATPLNLETVRRFAQVLEQETGLMRDPQGVEELEHMQKTTRAICAWLEAHPESLPKTRRFAEYYIPTTLKLLHTYNDVQGQQGGNAETIRRDIAGILHTLNQAYDNLYDKLLSDVALDVSSEIAALQGMLASDGLTGEGLL